jgi:3-carboxy-cis,cis-muconate cycloisomerase
LTGDALFSPIFVTDELLLATGDSAWLQALLDAEAALAGAQADCGLVPVSAAAAIAAACRAERFDAAALGRAGRGEGNPVIPLVAALRAETPVQAQRWVHWGATSQDILDTAAMLVCKRAGLLIEADVARLASACAEQARAYRHTLMAGRTLLQQALPITFGLKAAGWLAAVQDAGQQLVSARSGLAAQLGGAAGTLASLGDDGPAVLAAFASRLGLVDPALPWHSARQRISTLAGALGTVAGTVAKIGSDVVLLMQTEVSEAAEPAPGRSSTMPQKRNPASAVAAIAGARRAHALLPVLFSALVAEHERAAGAWQAEWQPLSELLALAGGAAARIADVVGGLEIHPQAMAANLAASGGVLMAERVSLAVTRLTGDREAAEDAVSRAARQALDGRGHNRPGFAEALAADPVIGAVLDRARIDELLDPGGYLGATGDWIDRALAAHEKGGA